MCISTPVKLFLNKHFRRASKTVGHYKQTILRSIIEDDVRGVDDIMHVSLLSKNGGGSGPKNTALTSSMTIKT